MFGLFVEDTQLFGASKGKQKDNHNFAGSQQKQGLNFQAQTRRRHLPQVALRILPSKYMLKSRVRELTHDLTLNPMG